MSPQARSEYIVTTQFARSLTHDKTVLGRVTDSSASVIPGAALQVANLATGVTLRGTTNGEGNYLFSFLIPGTYRITAEKDGLKRVVRDEIDLNVNGRLELDWFSILSPVTSVSGNNIEARAFLRSEVSAAKVS